MDLAQDLLLSIEPHSTIKALLLQNLSKKIRNKNKGNLNPLYNNSLTKSRYESVRTKARFRSESERAEYSEFWSSQKIFLFKFLVCSPHPTLLFIHKNIPVGRSLLTSWLT